MLPANGESTPGFVTLGCPLCGTVIVEPTPETGVAKLQFDDLECPSCGLVFPRPAPAPANPEPSQDGAEPANDEPVDPLQRWLDGAPIRPARRGWRQQASDWAREHRSAAMVFAATAVALTAASLAALTGCWLVWRELHATQVDRDALAAKCESLEDAGKDAARAAKRRERGILDKLAEAERGRATAKLDALASHAQQMANEAKRCATQQPQLALVLAGEASRILKTFGEPAPAGVLQCLWGVASSGSQRTLRGGARRPTVLAASVQKRWLACGGQDGELTLWDLKRSDGAGRRLPASHGRISDSLFTADGRWLASTGVDSIVRLWDLAEVDSIAKPILLPGHRGRISQLANSADGRWLVAASNGMKAAENSLRLWDLHADSPEDSGLEIAGHEGRLVAVAMSPHGRAIASANSDGTLRLWNRAEGRNFGPSVVLRGPAGQLHAMRFSPDSRLLAAACENVDGGESVLLWNASQHHAVSTPIELRGIEGAIRAIAFTPDGHWLIAAGADAALRAWDLTRDDVAACAASAPRGARPIVETTISASGKWLAGLDADGTILLWTLGARGPVGDPIEVRPESGSAAAIAISGNDQWLAGVSEGGAVQLWNLDVESLLAAAYAAEPRGTAEKLDVGHRERTSETDENPLR